MWLTMIGMVITIAITVTNEYPALQVILAGVLYAIIIAMIVMEFWM